ncbi:hypothetical protein KR067_011381, partial [Drosophila pandora]
TLLDSGSQINIITRRMADTLGLQLEPSTLNIAGLGGTTKRSRKKAVVTLSSLTTDFEDQINVVVLPEIMPNQPSHSIQAPRNISPQLRLADPEFTQPQNIDLLLGAEIISQLMRPQQTYLGEGQPLLKNTALGWIVMGP